MKIPIWFLIVLVVVSVAAYLEIFQAGKNEGLRLGSVKPTYTVTDSLGNILTAKTILDIECLSCREVYAYRSASTTAPKLPVIKHMSRYQSMWISDHVIQTILEVIKGDLMIVHCDRNERLSAHTEVSDELHNLWFEYNKNDFEAIANTDGYDTVTCKQGAISSFVEFELNREPGTPR